MTTFVIRRIREPGQAPPKLTALTVRPPQRLAPPTRPPAEHSSIPTPAWPQPVAPRPRFPAGSRLKPLQNPDPSRHSARFCPAASGEKRRRTAELTRFTHKMLPAGAPETHAPPGEPAPGAGTRHA